MQIVPWTIWFDLSRLAFESNVVIGLRLMRMAAGGQNAWSESQLMVTEKWQTAVALGMENAFALAGGSSVKSVGRHSVAKYRQAVRRNHRRLTTNS